jgi:hypothetical protein
MATSSGKKDLIWPLTDMTPPRQSPDWSAVHLRAARRGRHRRWWSQLMPLPHGRLLAAEGL